MDHLIAFFNLIQPLSEADKQIFRLHLYVEHIKKGNIYCEQSKICKKLGFISEGVFKAVKTNDFGDEFIQYFPTEGHFAVDLESFTNRTPAKEYIEALTNCTVVTIEKETFEMLEKTMPNFSKTINLIKEKALLEKYNLKSEMLTDDAQTRYNKLLKRQPSVIQRIPQSQIASFLGITQYTLSRIKAKK